MFFARPTIVLAALGSGATQFITYGLGNFATLFLMREKGMSLRQVAVYYSLVVGVAMTGGIFVSGRLIDRFTRTSKQAYGLIPATLLPLRCRSMQVLSGRSPGLLHCSFFFFPCFSTFSISRPPWLWFRRKFGLTSVLRRVRCYCWS
jgi:hypothetical protein